MKSLVKKIVLLSLIFFSYQSYTQTATISKNVLVTPCNCNGEVEYTFNGFTTFPITVYYFVNGSTTTKTINTNKDTLKNICQGRYTIEASTSNQSIGLTENYNIFTATNINIIDAICPGLGSIGATVAGGTSPLTFSCKDVSTNTIIGTTNPISVPAGEYIYTVKDANGCTYNIKRDSIQNHFGDTITVESLSNITYSVATTNASCTNGSATINSLTGGTAPYAYLWSNGATTSSITGLISDYYFLTVSDAQGCKKKTNYIWIAQNPIINVNFTATPATCVQSDGALIAFGSGGQNPYTYQWSTGATTQSIGGLTGGNYSYTVTDNNGCRGKGVAYVPTSTPIIINYTTTPSSCTSPTGSVTLNITGGTTPYTTTWYLSPIVNANTITNQPEGNYSFKVVDNVGCIQTGTVVIPPISRPTLYGYSTNPICPNTTGSISVSATGVTPLSYNWSNGATTNSISASLGGYTITVTDANNCKNTKGFVIESLPSFSVGINSTNVSCQYNSDGTATAVASGGGANTYRWTNGATSQTASGLGIGRYWVTVTKPNGCAVSSYVDIENNASSDACYCTIKGKVYHDANNNCTLDAGEAGIDNIMMHLKGFGYAFTDANGDYEFRVPTGTYKLSQEVKSIFPMSSCQTKEYNVSVTASSGCTQTFNFADSLIPSHDLFIATMRYYNSAIVPGEVYTQRAIVKNIGNVAETTGKFGYRHDNQLTLLSTTSALNKTSATRIDQSSSFPTLNPGSVLDNHIFYQVPTNIPINTNIVFQDTVAKALPLSTEWLEDLSPWNNVNYYTDIVVSSYDPNFKEVLPQGTGKEGIIPRTTKQLTYTIHFQNLGTYYAKKVVLVDTLDADLDLTTLSPITSSHKFKTYMDDNGVVRFIFDNIYLPAEKDGGDASNGFITYTINLKKDLADGTTINNFADIYFDYNEPVRTNTTHNTIEKSLASVDNKNTDIDKSEFNIYPNPATNQFNTEIKANQYIKEASMAIFDLQGKQIYQWNGSIQKGESKKEFDTDKLSNGIYIINLELGGEKFSKKIVIEK